MSKITNYLKGLGIPESTISQLENDQDIDVTDLARQDYEAIGKHYAKDNPHRDDKSIIAIKTLKGDTFKLLRDMGVNMGDLSRSKAEEMPDSDFVKYLKTPIESHLTTIKGSADEQLKSNYDTVLKRFNELQDQYDGERKTWESEKIQIEGRVQKEIHAHKLDSSLSRIDSEFKWGVQGSILEAVKSAGRHKIQELGVTLLDNDMITDNQGLPVKYNGQVVRTLKDLHTSIYGDVAAKSNGNTGGPFSVKSIEGSHDMDKHTAALLEQAAAAGVRV